MGELFSIESVSCMSYTNQIGVSLVTPYVCHKKNSIKLIYFDTPGSSFSRKNYQQLIILDTKNVNVS